MAQLNILCFNSFFGRRRRRRRGNFTGPPGGFDPLHLLLLSLNQVTLFGFNFFLFFFFLPCTCFLPLSLHLSPHFPCSLVGYNAGSQPALQTDGPLIRCASALPPLPAARFLIKLKPKDEERERARVEEKEGKRGLGRLLACFGVYYLFE